MEIPAVKIPDSKAPGLNGQEGRSGLRPERMAERIIAYAPSQL